MVNKLLVTISIALSACAYDASYGDCAVHCTTDSGCPNGLTCSAEGLCRSAGAVDQCSEPAAEPISCADLAPTCGATGTESCCESPLLPSGTFNRSDDPASPASVNAFRLDRYEITVGRFRAFVMAGMGTQANPPPAGTGARALNGLVTQGGWDPTWNNSLPIDTVALKMSVKCDGSQQAWTDAPGANENLPMNCITWFEAFAFCAWDGGFLPTEAEWNYAAAGGSEQRAYPWSDPATTLTIDCTYANYAGCDGGVRRVGSRSPRGDGKWGHADLAGNVWEWTLDWYAASYATPCEGCADLLPPQTLRTNRGGGFSHDATYLRTAFRGYESPMPPHATIGVRCARMP